MFRSFSIRQLLVAVFVVAVLLGSLIGLKNRLNPMNDRPFSQEEWASGEQRKICMVDDLLANYLTQGVARESVSRWLGTPESSHVALDRITDEYYLGQMIGIENLRYGGDDAMLIVEYHQEKLIGVEVTIY